MIKLGGGDYIFKGLKNSNPENKSGSVTISMEEFYSKAKDCDYLIYNSTIDSPIKSIDDLIQKNKLFKKFKAVKNPDSVINKNTLKKILPKTTKPMSIFLIGFYVFMPLIDL